MNYFPSTASLPFSQVADSIIISNSESLDWIMCERRHFYAHVMKLAPKHAIDAVSRGILGHEALAEFYIAKREGKNKNSSYKAMMNPIDLAIAKTAMSEDWEVNKTYIDLKSLLTQYANVHFDDPIKVIEVESVHVLATPVAGVLFGMKLDLLVEWTAGSMKGDLVLFDHKFPYNFRSQVMQSLNPQLPKYIAALQSDGIPVRKGYVNQIRYRSIKNANYAQIFNRLPIAPSPEELEQFAQEQFDISLRIKERTALPIEIQDKMALRVRSQSVCDRCPFQKLCVLEQQSGSAQSGSQKAKDLIKYYYKASTYGYNKHIINEDGDE